VKIPDGTAAVSADNQSSSTKVGHWEPGKAELDSQVRRPTKRILLATLWWMGTSVDEQENGCDDQI